MNKPHYTIPTFPAIASCIGSDICCYDCKYNKACDEGYHTLVWLEVYRLGINRINWW